MITITPAHAPYTRSYQDCDERQALLLDLSPTLRPGNAKAYLNHADATVRSLADWTMEYYKLRNIRWDMNKDETVGRSYLDKLYQRLRVLASQ
jgi:hypothetical protein